ncbi:MAG: NAD(P)/FAD-dependent oxidoreductase [Desulfomonilaceae bacterium]|nr:NAD(P)/FAD-dependent oxidoreductase [Desulfomonilaceae bacterium]
MTAPRVDVLVLGAGMGGLSAAALLARKGLKTLVAERLPRIGGRCSTLDYKGFKCTTGVIGVELGGVVENLFRTVGAKFDVREAGAPHYLIDGRTVEVPPKGGLKTLLAAASDDEGEIDRVLRAFSAAMRTTGFSEEVCLKDWLLRHTRNDAILRIFQTMVSATLLVNTHELPAREFFAFIKKLGGVKRFGYCPGGSIDLARALAEKICDFGGEVRTSAPARRILVEEGRARGAVLSKDGADVEVRASVVISNIGPLRTLQLAGEENFTGTYVDDVRQNGVPAVVVAVHMSSDEPLIEHDHLLITGAQSVNALYQPTVVCPELAPAGTHMILAGGGPRSSLPPLDTKRVLEACFADLNDLIPDFARRVKILLTGTFHRTWPGMHCWPGKDVPQETPVKGLYQVGDGAKPSGTTGLPSAVESGMMVAEAVSGLR